MQLCFLHACSQSTNKSWRKTIPDSQCPHTDVLSIVSSNLWMARWSTLLTQLPLQILNSCFNLFSYYCLHDLILIKKIMLLIY